MCHIVLTSLLYVTLISAEIHTMTLQGQYIRKYTCIHLFQQFHFNYTSIHVYTYEITLNFLINDPQNISTLNLKFLHSLAVRIQMT